MLYRFRQVVYGELMASKYNFEIVFLTVTNYYVILITEKLLLLSFFPLFLNRLSIFQI